MFTILKAVSVSGLTAYQLFSEIGNWFSNLCRRYSLLQSYHLCLVLVCLIALRSDLLISQIVPLLLWEGSRSCPSLACLSTRTCWRALGDHIQFFKASLSCSLAGIIRRLWSDKILSHHPDLNWSLMLQQNLIWHTRDFHSDYFIRVFLITIVLFEDLFSKVLSSMITFQDHLVADPVQSVLVQCYL